MAQELKTELIRVSGISPYSVYSGQQRYSFNKGINSGMFTKGNTYSVSVAISAKGAKYIHTVSNDLGVLQADVSSGPALNPAINQASSFKKSVDSGLSKEEWAAKDVRISRSGVIQAAVQAVASHSKNAEDLQAKAIILAEAMLVWVNQKTSIATEQAS